MRKCQRNRPLKSVDLPVKILTNQTVEGVGGSQSHCDLSGWRVGGLMGFREQARAYRREMSGGRMHSARSAPFQPGKPDHFM